MIRSHSAPIIAAVAGLALGGSAGYGQSQPAQQFSNSSETSQLPTIAVSTKLTDLGRNWQPEQQLYLLNNFNISRKDQLEIASVLEQHKSFYVFAAKVEAPTATSETFRALSTPETEVITAVKDQVTSSPYFYRMQNSITQDSNAVALILFFNNDDKFYGMAYLPNTAQKAAGVGIADSMTHANSVGVSVLAAANTISDMGLIPGLNSFMTNVDNAIVRYETKFTEQAGKSSGIMFADSRSDEAQHKEQIQAVLKVGGVAIGVIVGVIVILGVGAVLLRRNSY